MTLAIKVKKPTKKIIEHKRNRVTIDLVPIFSEGMQFVILTGFRVSLHKVWFTVNLTEQGIALFLTESFESYVNIQK